MKNRVKLILRDLEAVRENLLALSDDIWLSIDHNDPDSLEEGYQFKKAYNQKMISFDRISQEISSMIQQFLDVKLGEEIAQQEEKSNEENVRIIKELDKEIPHDLNEDFSYKRPYGFVLEGKAYKDIDTWRRLYTVFCKHLYNRDPKLFSSLIHHENFISRRGNKTFSNSPDDFANVAIPITKDIYADGNLSANSIRNNMKKLMEVFEIPIDQLVIYLREDRNAEK
ncbi:hypothetical protein [Geobacillus thermodenitrificans]